MRRQTTRVAGSSATLASELHVIPRGAESAPSAVTTLTPEGKDAIRGRMSVESGAVSGAAEAAEAAEAVAGVEVVEWVLEVVSAVPVMRSAPVGSRIGPGIGTGIWTVRVCPADCGGSVPPG
ncbi:hypothetical protein GCM10010234_57090 [Streptomyces hawaiiensis]